MCLGRIMEMPKWRRQVTLLRLLWWKNYKFRRHHFCGTILELLLPCLTFLVFALLLWIGDLSISRNLQESLESTLNQIPPAATASQQRQLLNRCYSNPTDPLCPRCTVNQICPEEYIVQYLRDVKKREIAFAPDNQLTRGIMQRLIKDNRLNGWNFTGFPSETELELANIKSNRPLRQAIIFQNGFTSNKWPSGTKLAYKLRFANMGHTFYELDNPWEGTQDDWADGRRNSENEPVHGGYTAMQIMLDKLLIRMILESKSNGVQVPVPAALQESISMIRILPFGLMSRDLKKASAYSNGLQDLLDLFTTVYATLFTLSYTPLIPVAIVGVVSEKQFGAKELTNMMGMSNTLYMLAWLLDAFVMSIISSAIVTTLLFLPTAPARNQLLSAGDGTIVFFVILTFAMATRCWSFLFAAPFRNPVFPCIVGMATWVLVFLSIAWGDRYTGLAPLSRDIVMSIFLPPLALRYIFRIFLILSVPAPLLYEDYVEDIGKGITWSNVASKFPGEKLAPLFDGNEGMSVLHVLALMLLGSIIYCVMALYIESVAPSSVAVPKPWYFPIKPIVKYVKDRRRRSQRKPKDISREEAPKLNYTMSSASNLNLFPVVEIKNVTKKFGNHIAVDNMCCSILENQITCLLGHNGAGKTTTMSMITGYLVPTSGSITVLEADASTETEKAREYISWCPQFSIYFNFLNVQDHFLFFSRLRGVRNPELESANLIKAVDLAAKQKTLAGQLSGGQQRKLSLGLALIGDIEMVILDEPTTGIDPESRRFIWNLLLAQRSRRAILLSTHFMEEAEVLSDTIIIMYNGRVVSWGSPTYLKRTYAPEYVLSLTLEDPEQADHILDGARQVIESVATNPEASSKGSFQLCVPNTPAQRTKLPELFRTLEENKEEWGIQEIGVSVTTVDDVFTRVRDEERRKEGKKRYSSFAYAGDEVSLVNHKGSRLLISQARGLVTKRLIDLRRRWYLTVAQILLAVIPVIVYLYIEKVDSRDPIHPHEPLTAPIKFDSNAITPYISVNADGIAKTYRKFIGKSAEAVKASPQQDLASCQLILSQPGNLGKLIQDYFKGFQLKKGLKKFERIQVGGAFVCNNLTSIFSGLYKHSVTVSVNAVSNALLEKYAPGYSIQITNQPLRKSVVQIQDAIYVVNEIIGGIIFGTLLTFGLSLALAVFYVVPAQERQIGIKQIQTMTGLSPMLYWTTFFLIDLVIAVLIVIIVAAIFPIRSTSNIFTAGSGFGVLVLIGTVYAYAALHFGYAFTLLTSSAGSGFIFLSSLHVVTGIICGLITQLIRLESASQAAAFKYLFRIFPSYGLALALFQFAENALARDSCSYVKRDDMACRLLFKFKKGSLYTKRCCTSSGDNGGVQDLTWTVFLNSDQRGRQTTANVGQELFWMFLMGLSYQCLLYFWECYLQPKLRSQRPHPREFWQLTSQDENVISEIKKVDTLVSEGSTADWGIVVHRVGRAFSRRVAVASVSFAVNRGECFGFLGVNGAGKTTTFRMLTGDVQQQRGEAWIDGVSIRKNERKFLSKIGYCSQKDTLLPHFTGRQMLELMGRLRGVSKLQGTVELWLHLLGLKKSGNARCGDYSGGMKRLLCAGMALIGNPVVAFLDEPTSGVDPVTRRRFWDVLREAQDLGTTIILTSHSMDECEALCSRVSILVNGELKCLGTPDALKHKYAPGVKLVIKLLPETITAEVRATLVYKVAKIWPASVIRYENETLLQFALPTGEDGPDWEHTFSLTEQVCSEFSDFIEDYSLSDNSLEDVLLSFSSR